MKRFLSSLAVVLVASLAPAQLAERPGISTDTDPVNFPKDLSGRNVKHRRVRVIHTTDPNLEGGSAWFQAKDPWHAYRRGLNLTQIQWRQRDGAFGKVGTFAGVLPDGITPDKNLNHTNSCGFCHATPYGDNGAGGNFDLQAGLGRNTPHFFGGGLVEMIGLQTRLQVLGLLDLDRNGWVARDEAVGVRVLIVPEPGARPIDFGTGGDNDGNGVPDLNPVFRIWYVDANGRRLPTATSLNAPGVAGYNFQMRLYGWTINNGTLRGFTTAPMNVHAGIQAFDPTTNDDPDGDGLSGISNAGAQQFTIDASPDTGRNRNAQGLSLDDPDADGYINEMTEGDLDIAEWNMLNAPTPALWRQTGDSRRGRKLFHQFGCATCHVPDWVIQPADPQNPDYTQRFAGDRRFFDLVTHWNGRKGRLEGRIRPLYRMEGDQFVPLRGGFVVKDVFSDFAHHDLGPTCTIQTFDGSLTRKIRTPPLWGAGSSGPYGHDGASMTLDDIILRHGGEAQASANAFRRSPERHMVTAFLRSLILYSPSDLPCDINGDGRIEEHFTVAGRDTGEERFNPEWLFRVPLQIEGQVPNPQGITIQSLAGVNCRDAYGWSLPYLQDSDDDGFPDLIDPCPSTRGFKDGCN